MIWMSLGSTSLKDRGLGGDGFGPPSPLGWAWGLWHSRDGSRPPSAECHQQLRQSLLGATEHIQARGCGLETVWEMLSRCGDSGWVSLPGGMSVCQQKELTLHPPGRLQLSSPSWVATELLRQGPGWGEGPLLPPPTMPRLPRPVTLGL